MSRRKMPTDALLHQNTRYFRSRKKGLGARSWYAATSVFITRNDDGDHIFSTAESLGTLNQPIAE
jgi:hypothetical protein